MLMMNRRLPQLACALLAAWMFSAMAQTVPAPANAAASAPRAAKPGPRLQTPLELREGATAPGDLRPDERVTPQIVIPLRKDAPPPTKAERAAARRGTAASASGGIDDSVARCEAQASKPAREKCLASLPTQSGRP
jgi:hypothetical protein